MLNSDWSIQIMEIPKLMKVEIPKLMPAEIPSGRILIGQFKNGNSKTHKVEIPKRENGNSISLNSDWSI